jgi:hypothetical protein
MKMLWKRMPASSSRHCSSCFLFCASVFSGLSGESSRTWCWYFCAWGWASRWDSSSSRASCGPSSSGVNSRSESLSSSKDFRVMAGEASEKAGDRPANKLSEDSMSCSTISGLRAFNLGVPLLYLPKLWLLLCIGRVWASWWSRSKLSKPAECTCPAPLEAKNISTPTTTKTDIMAIKPGIAG